MDMVSLALQGAWKVLAAGLILGALTDVAVRLAVG